MDAEEFIRQFGPELADSSGRIPPPYLNYDSALQSAREVGTPDADAFVHDAEYLKPFFDKWFSRPIDTNEETHEYHNSAVEYFSLCMAIDSVTVANMGLGMLSTGEERQAFLHHFFQEVIAGAFLAGLEAGEGQDHIVKCRCSNSVKEN